MKPGVSSLNPYAASYMPLSKRDTSHNVTAKMETETVGAALSESPASLMLKDQTNASFSAANQGIENQVNDEELDMVIKFLQMNFPGLSSESLIDVYWANYGDLEETVDMLNQLEISLPDTLEIGDVSESASHKLKNVATEGLYYSNCFTAPAPAPAPNQSRPDLVLIHYTAKLILPICLFIHFVT